MSKRKRKSFNVRIYVSPKGKRFTMGFCSTIRKVGPKLLQWGAASKTDFARLKKRIEENK